MRSLPAEIADQLRRHGSRVSAAHQRLKAARAERNEAIKQAIAAGQGIEQELADASGVSRSRVSQLRRELERE